MTDEQLVNALTAINEQLVHSIVEAHKPTWKEHFDLVQVLLVVSLAYIIWSLKKMLKDFEGSLRELWKSHGVLRDEVHVIKGRHEERDVICYGRRKEDPTP